MFKLKYFIQFCRFFHNSHVPKMKFKELNETYKSIYKNVYNIDENDINKASFVIWIFSFLLFLILSLFLTLTNFLIIIFYSFIISIIISYRFNITLYRIIRKEESQINALMYFLIINFSLIKNTLKKNTDYSIAFINLIKNSNMPFSEYFKIILKRIHEGELPEKQLFDLITPSEDFNFYVKDLLVNNFTSSYELDYFNENISEKRFKVILKDIESKISIVFFIGLFFPIALCFLILFNQFSLIMLIIFIPFFLILLNFLFKKLIKVDIFLIGFLNEYSNLEKKQFDEFLMFLKVFSLNLKNNLSPEKAFINAYNQNKKFYNLIKKSFNKNLYNLINIACTFNEMIDKLKIELKSIRYRIILDTIRNMLEENAFYSSEKIIEILKIISKHKKLEAKLNVIIQGEKFKALFFIFLLPIIIGAIGGMLPLLIFITRGWKDISHFSLKNYFDLINILNFFLIFTTLFISNLISCYYFLKLIKIEKKILIFLISSVIYILTFFISFINLFTLI